MSLRSFRTKLDGRRSTYIHLSGDVETQLREAFDERHQAGEETQASLAEKLGVNRSVIHRRLTGRANLTLSTLADMVWALGYAIKIVIYKPSEAGENAYPATITSMGKWSETTNNSEIRWQGQIKTEAA
jgi:hypothetical protein